MKEAAENEEPDQGRVEGGLHPSVVSLGPGVGDAFLIFLGADFPLEESRNLTAVTLDVTKVEPIEEKLDPGVKAIERHEEPKEPVLVHKPLLPQLAESDP
jgi:hypothetical protein